MEVYNETKQRLVAPNVRVGRDLVSQLVGLIGRKELPPGEGLWLPFCSGVHTLFVRFPIDVVLLDSEMQVLALVRDLKPWRATRLFRKARHALELPAGAIAAAGIDLGDRLTLRE